MNAMNPESYRGDLQFAGMPVRDEQALCLRVGPAERCDTRNRCRGRFSTSRRHRHWQERPEAADTERAAQSGRPATHRNRLGRPGNTPVGCHNNNGTAGIAAPERESDNRKYKSGRGRWTPDRNTIHRLAPTTSRESRHVLRAASVLNATPTDRRDSDERIPAHENCRNGLRRAALLLRFPDGWVHARVVSFAPKEEECRHPGFLRGAERRTERDLVQSRYHRGGALLPSALAADRCDRRVDHRRRSAYLSTLRNCVCPIQGRSASHSGPAQSQPKTEPERARNPCAEHI